ncbi:MAG: hypothetical protein ACOWWH_01500, partial [Eubacteriaceae bacterium]
MKFNQRIIIKRWRPILEEYEKIQNKVSPRSFRLVKDLFQDHHISNKELRRYFLSDTENRPLFAIQVSGISLKVYQMIHYAA